jgi:hypothetical protein
MIARYSEEGVLLEATPVSVVPSRAAASSAVYAPSGMGARKGALESANSTDPACP